MTHDYTWAQNQNLNTPLARAAWSDGNGGWIQTVKQKSPGKWVYASGPAQGARWTAAPVDVAAEDWGLPT